MHTYCYFRDVQLLVAAAIDEYQLSTSRYIKMIKSELSDRFDVEFGFKKIKNQRCSIRIQGTGVACRAAQQELDKITKRLQTTTLLTLSTDFCKCLQKANDDVIIAELRKSDVHAGWDVSEECLTVESTSTRDINAAVDILKSLISERKYPANRPLSKPEKALLMDELEQIQSRYPGAIIKYNKECGQLSITAFKETADSLCVELTMFFLDTTDNAKFVFQDEKAKYLIERNILRLAQKYPYLKEVDFHDDSNTCSFSSEHAACIVEQLQSLCCSITSATIVVEPPSLAEWIHTKEGEIKLNDIGELSGTIIALKEDPNTASIISHLEKIIITQQSLLLSKV